MLYMRNVRFTIMGVNMLLLGFVETARIEDRRLNLAIQLLGKRLSQGISSSAWRWSASSRGAAAAVAGGVVRARKLALRRLCAARHSAVRARDAPWNVAAVSETAAGRGLDRERTFATRWRR